MIMLGADFFFQVLVRRVMECGKVELLIGFNG